MKKTKKQKQEAKTKQKKKDKKEERQEQERDRERETKRGKPNKVKGGKKETQKINKKLPFLGGKQGFSI